MAATQTAQPSTTLVDHLRRQLRVRPDEPALHFRAGRRWAPITWAQFGVAARRFAACLLEEGLAAGDRIAIWCENRPEWLIADAGAMSVGVVTAAIPESWSGAEAARGITRCRARLVLVDTMRRAAALTEAGCASTVVVLADDRTDPHTDARADIAVDARADIAAADAGGTPGQLVSWTSVLDRGQAALTARSGELERRGALVDAGDALTIVHASGPAERRPPVVLTHRNVLAAIAASAALVTTDESDRALCHLPLSDIRSRMSTEMHALVFGNQVFIAPADEELAGLLRAVRPTLLVGDDEVWTSIAERVAGHRGRGGAQRLLLSWAMRRGAGSKLADRLVLSRVRTSLGLDAARLLVRHGRAADVDTLRALRSAGLDVCDAYGPVGTAGRAAMTRPGDARPRESRPGSVGRALAGVEVRIAADGEVLIRGDVVCAGHLDDDGELVPATEDGWLRTGDCGVLEPDGALRITSRTAPGRSDASPE